MAVIYKLTNKVNGFIYIGCTKNLKGRMRGHKSAHTKRECDLYLAMRQYGFDNFELSIIEEVADDIRYDRERYWIKELDSINPAIGYNRTIGGTGTIGYKFTDEVRKKMSQNIKGKYKPSAEQIEHIRKLNLGKHLSEVTRKKLSDACMGRPSAFKGHHHTKESIALARQTKKERGILKPIIGVSIKSNERIEFDSLSDASRFIVDMRGGKLSTVTSHISNVALGKLRAKSAYGFKWEFVEKSNDYPDKE